jgi:RHS repeat-associated protein
MRGVSAVGVVTWRQYHYDLQWRVMDQRIVGSADPEIEYVDGSGMDEHLQMSAWSNGQTSEFYYHCSSQGFVGALTDAAGSRVMEYEYSWLGEARVTGSGAAGLAGQNPYQFQGRQFDAESELYQFRNRYFDSAVGEFWSIDPSGLWQHAQGNGYSALSVDVWNRVDPLGLLTVGMKQGQGDPPGGSNPTAVVAPQDPVRKCSGGIHLAVGDANCSETGTSKRNAKQKCKHAWAVKMLATYPCKGRCPHVQWKCTAQMTIGKVNWTWLCVPLPFFAGWKCTGIGGNASFGIKCDCLCRSCASRVRLPEGY